MFVTALELHDFRSYETASLSLAAGVTVFVGANGQGKTNLVEAVDYLATLGSHRVSSDVPLVRAGAERAVVRGRVQAGLDDPRSLLLEVEITPGRANRARLNRAPLPRTRDLLGALRTVVFAPDDLALVKGDPAVRRRFIDELVIARWPRMAGVIADYERVLKQRNALLKSVSGRSYRQASPDLATTLDSWDEPLARFGGEILAARLDTLAALGPYAEQAYATIAPTNNNAVARYTSKIETSDPSLDALSAAMVDLMAARRSDELQRGVSLVGPHRDDITLTLGELPAKGYASHGESWSCALALRLGAFSMLRADGIEPVLILDDVFAELDATRRERLAQSALSAEQVMVTAAVDDDIPAALAGARFRVSKGQVEAE
ncbi:MAG: DNA replication/repair protein RecF [Propionibacteriaceae bacterium]